MARPLHWKAFLHVHKVDGALIVRRDIVNAHQSVRRSPEQPPVFSGAIPGIRMEDENGDEACIQWLNMLNGMPPAGRGFTDDLEAHLRSFGMTPTVTDNHVFTKFWYDVEPLYSKYVKTCNIVDDMLVAVKPAELIDTFDAHLEKRWAIKRMGLDGFVNNNFYFNDELNTFTMTMDVRLTEIMKEHLPDRLNLDDIEYPKTPYHPRFKELATSTDIMTNAEDIKMVNRLQMQLMYCVVQVYFAGQYVVFFCARRTVKPPKIKKAVLLYALEHLYGTRHMGLTLGGLSDSGYTLVTRYTSEPDELVLPDAPYHVGGHGDAGHAEPGPSTGGHTYDINNTTIHAVSGQHHAVTLTTTDAESYEISQCVAGTVAFRGFMTEIGFPQAGPSPVYCDNFGTCRKSASDASDKRSLYMKKRVKFVADAQEVGEVKVTKIQSEDNRADILTKVLSGAIFVKMRDLIYNIRRAAVRLHAIVKGKTPS